MSYQGWGCSAWLTDWEFIKSIAPDEAKNYEKACKETYPDDELPMDEAAYYLSLQEIDGGEPIVVALIKLNDKFCKETGGLTLDSGWISYEEVDSDVHGGVWYVGGVKEFTPAGKKYEKNLRYEQWVEYG